jgi:RHS repeat-associated protein
MNRLLTSSKSGQGFSYVYDRFGNRWQQNVTAGSGPNPQYSFDANNRIVGGSYDAAGNLLNDGTHAYTYDAENRISKVDGGNTATFTYDAEGRRAGKNTYTYLYDLAGHAVAELNGGTWDRSEVYAAGRHLATYSGSTTYFPHVDWLGTERVRTNTAGNIVETCTSLPFGDGQSCTGTDVSPNHFTGKQRDTETNLDDFPARYYSSTEGRWLSPDWSPVPVAIPYASLYNPQTLNLYDYVGDDPTNHSDPDGHEDEGSAASSGDSSGSTPDQTQGAGPAQTPAQQKIQQPALIAQNQDTEQPQSSNSSSGRVNSPAQGQQPDTTVTIPGNKPGESTERTYGPDGRAVKDVDRGHDHGAGDPHAHDWDWSKTPARQPGRPLTPDEAAKTQKSTILDWAGQHKGLIATGVAAGAVGAIILTGGAAAPALAFAF